MTMTEEEFDRLADVRGRVPKQRRLLEQWQARLQEAEGLVAQLQGELDAMEAEATELSQKAGLTSST